MDIYLPIAEMSINAFWLLGLGVIVGFLSGLFGIGGGFLMTPFLTFMGIPAAIAVASQANQQVGTSLSGALAHYRRKNVDFQMAFILMVGSIMGTWGGVQLFKWLKQIGQINLVIVLCYVTLLSIVGILMFWETLPRLLKNSGRNRTAPRLPAVSEDSKGLREGWGARSLFAMEFPVSRLRVSLMLPLGLGVLAGVLVSLLGVGGFVMVPAMIYVLKMPPRLVNGTSLVQIIFTSSLATVMQCISNHSVDILLAIMMLCGSVVGVPFGARLSSKLKPEVARFLMALLIVFVDCMLIYELIYPRQLFAINVTVLL